MNNQTLLKLAVFCVLSAAATSVYANTSITGITTIGNSTFSPSANVTVTVDAASANYAAYSQHLSGNRIFFSNNNDPKLYFNTKSTGTTTSVTPSATMAVPSDYSSL